VIREVEFTARKLWDLRGSFPHQPFAAVDPGAEGAVVCYDRVELRPDGLIHKPVAVFPLSVPLEVIARELVARGVKLLLMEAQYQGVNKTTVIKLARRAAYLPGFLAGMWQPEDVTVFWLLPATWQAVLRKLEGKKKLAAGEAKKLAEQYANRIYNGDGRWTGATKAQRSGIADATAIALWAQRALWLPPSQEVRTACDD
jgi:hypothetical protein